MPTPLKTTGLKLLGRRKQMHRELDQPKEAIWVGKADSPKVVLLFQSACDKGRWKNGCSSAAEDGMRCLYTALPSPEQPAVHAGELWKYTQLVRFL